MNTSKLSTSTLDSSHHLQQVLLLWSKSTPEQQAKVFECLHQEQSAKKYPLPAVISDLVESHIRDEAFTLEAITKSIFAWATNQEALPIEAGTLDMDVGDVITLSDMAIRKAQRIVNLANEFACHVTSAEVEA